MGHRRRDECVANRGNRCLVDSVTLAATGKTDEETGKMVFYLDRNRLREGRKARVVAQFSDALEAHGACAGNSCAVCTDMSASYQAGVCEHLPWAAITFDEFHAIQLVNRAVDAVRRQEVKRAPERRRTRYIWLQDKHAWSNRQKARFAELKRRNLKTHRGFRIQETLRELFLSAQSAAQAEPLLDRWSG